MKGYYNKDDLNPHKDRKIEYDSYTSDKDLPNKVEINDSYRYNRYHENALYDLNIEEDLQHDKLMDASRIEGTTDKSNAVSSKIAVLAIMAFMAFVIVGAVGFVVFKEASEASDERSSTVVDNNLGDETVIDEETSVHESEVVIDDKKEIENTDNSIKEEYTQTTESDSEIKNSSGSSEDEVRKKVEELSKNDTRVATILNNFDQYPINLMKDIVRNQEMIDFTLGYLDGIGKVYDENIDIAKEINDTTYPIPLLMQWDKRWGYYAYGNSTIGISGCGPTSLNMVYIAITGDQTINPLKMVKFSNENGYVVPGVGTSWELMTEGASKLGLSSSRLSNKDELMSSNLMQGNYLIASMGPGTFTEKGHFIVFSGYENGQYRINDPFCIAHSQKLWSYNEFGSQIKALWVFQHR